MECFSANERIYLFEIFVQYNKNSSIALRNIVQNFQIERIHIVHTYFKRLEKRLRCDNMYNIPTTTNISEDLEIDILAYIIAFPEASIRDVRLIK